MRPAPAPDPKAPRLTPEHLAEQKALAKAARAARAAVKSGAERVVWRLRGELVPTPELDTEAALAGLLRALGTTSDDSELALVVQGPHAATLLAHEDGEHHHVAGTETKMVRVVVRPPSGALPHPSDLGGPRPRVRTFQENKRIVIDHVLDTHLAVTPRLFRSYRHFMDRHVVRAVLGADGLAWADAWGAR
jgi:hypothetical protein